MTNKHRIKIIEELKEDISKAEYQLNEDVVNKVPYSLMKKGTTRIGIMKKRLKDYNSSLVKFTSKLEGLSKASNK